MVFNDKFNLDQKNVLYFIVLCMKYNILRNFFGDCITTFRMPIVPLTLTLCWCIWKCTL